MLKNIFMLSVQGDVYFMKEAIKEAKKSRAAGEVPIGAIVVSKGQIIAKGHNQSQC